MELRKASNLEDLPKPPVGWVHPDHRKQDVVMFNNFNSENSFKSIIEQITDLNNSDDILESLSDIGVTCRLTRIKTVQNWDEESGYIPEIKTVELAREVLVDDDTTWVVKMESNEDQYGDSISGRNFVLAFYNLKIFSDAHKLVTSMCMPWRLEEFIVFSNDKDVICDEKTIPYLRQTTYTFKFVQDFDDGVNQFQPIQIRVTYKATREEDLKGEPEIIISVKKI